MGKPPDGQHIVQEAVEVTWRLWDVLRQCAKLKHQPQRLRDKCTLLTTKRQSLMLRIKVLGLTKDYDVALRRSFHVAIIKDADEDI